jgi:heat shock protein beta
MYELKGILFIPGIAPFDATRDTRKNTTNIRLYVKKVFISDSFNGDLVPGWLSYLKGVIDCADLPLNVSRELLQESRIMRTIRKQIVTRALALLKSLQDDNEKWSTFWDAFGKEIKMGIVEDSTARTELSRLCRFYSSIQPTETTSDSRNVNNMTTLDSYVSRMKEGQNSIFYFATNNIKTSINVPFVEKLVKEGYEVLLMSDPLDEYVAMNLGKFTSSNSTTEFELVDVTRENVELGGDELESNSQNVEEYKELCEFMKGVLKDKVEKVVLSSRLALSPCVLVASKFGWSANMERIMKAQAGADARAYEYMRGKRSMEINPSSKIIQCLLREVTEKKDVEKARDAVEFMYQAALITSGYELDNPQEFAMTVYSLIEKSLYNK